ncbi:type II secretion system protein [Thermodesulfobacteriota bacterium]
MSKRNGQKGFTLIEIVMVIILLGILAAVAIPKFENLSDGAHDAAIDGAFGAVTSALSIAIARDKAVPVVAAGVTGFDQTVIANVDLIGGIGIPAAGTGSYGNTGAGEFWITSGVSGSGKYAIVTYSLTSGSPNLSIGAKTVWP